MYLHLKQSDFFILSSKLFHELLRHLIDWSFIGEAGDYCELLATAHTAIQRAYTCDTKQHKRLVSDPNVEAL